MVVRNKGGFAVWVVAVGVLAWGIVPCAMAQTVAASSLTGKVVCGYQGWYMAPGDGNPSFVGWRHWSRSSADLGPGLFICDLWPDVSEYDPDELFASPHVTLRDGSMGKLFSSITPKTVDRHFRWMKEYGIDGVFLQRFITEVQDSTFFDIRNQVLQNVMNAATNQGRVFALEYDTTGTSSSQMLQRLTNDWKYLVDHVGIRNHPRYLHHNGKPVIELWGLGFRDRGHTPAMAASVINFFKNDPVYGGNYVIGGVPAFWRVLDQPGGDSEPDPAWASVYLSYDMVSPWVSGRFTNDAQVDAWARDVWPDDLSWTQSHGVGYLPVVWPGFSWDNLMQQPPGTSTVPRNGGRFFWRQIYAWRNLGVDKMFVGMFDEADEATAIYKISDNPPTSGHWITMEGYPSDWYLQLTGAAGRMLRREIPLSETIPIMPVMGKIVSSAPSSLVDEGILLTLTAPDTSANPKGYQWYRNGSVIAGAMEQMCVLNLVHMSDAGSYKVVYRNNAGIIVESQPYMLTVRSVNMSAGSNICLVILAIAVCSSFRRRLAVEWQTRRPVLHIDMDSDANPSSLLAE